MKAKKKFYVRICFDIVMMIILVMLYKKSIISLMFHEIAGLCVLALMLIHLFVNRKWIFGLTKRVFRKKLPGKTRFLYFLDALLVLAFAICGGSGILISKKLFAINASGLWKPLHFSSAAIAIILIGIHLGMHLKGIKTALGIKLPKWTAVLLSLIIVGGGVFSFTRSDMQRWIGSAFYMSGAEHAGADMHYGSGNGYGRGQMMGKGENAPQNGENHMGQFSVWSVLQLICMYGSIILGIAILTALIDKTAEKKKYRSNIDSNT